MKNIKLFEEIYDKLKKGLTPRVDLHVHTNWTDGQNTVFEMHEEACNKSLSHIFFSEHSRKNSNDWFFEFCKQVDSLPKDICTALKGTEVKILNFNGEIDINENFYNECDLIMASVHRFPGETSKDFKNKKLYEKDLIIKTEFDLMISSLDNPKVDILGHPFGMTLNRFGFEPHAKLFDDLILQCKKKGKIFEVNFRYHRNPKLLIEKCIKSKTLFSLGSNAHSLKELGKILEIF